MYLSLGCEYTWYIIDFYVTHSLKPLSPEDWPGLNFGHHISDLIAGVFVAEIDDINILSHDVTHQCVWFTLSSYN